VILAGAEGAASRFLGAMAKGVAVVIGTDRDGKTAASAVSGLASYSIDPPSVVASVPRELLASLGGAFGVSLLTSDQHRIALELWEGPHELEQMHERLAGVSVIRGALAQLVCQSALTEEALDRGIVVGNVIQVALGMGRPLLAGGLGSA